MITVDSDALFIAAIWTASNIAFMLLLGINVYRNRARARVAIGTGDDERLERAIRTHGNNIEYVPGAILCLIMLALLGESNTLLHLLGGGLLLSRILHAHGIHDMRSAVSITRVIGNVLCWSLLVVAIGRLFYLSV
jgi:uncharacterized membrane protein YecN with MAPEG domain